MNETEEKEDMKKQNAGDDRYRKASEEVNKFLENLEMKSIEIRKKLLYKFTWKLDYEKLKQELSEGFNEPKHGFVSFMSLKPEYEYDLVMHCSNLNHVNYICDIEKVQFIFCPICKIKTMIGYNGAWHCYGDTKKTGLSVKDYCAENQIILDRCENLCDAPFQTRDEILDHVFGVLNKDM